jgi:hypothetical protein
MLAEFSKLFGKVIYKSVIDFLTPSISFQFIQDLSM